MGNFCNKNKQKIDIERYGFENYMSQCELLPLNNFISTIKDYRFIIIDKNNYSPQTRWERNYIGKEQKIYFCHRKIYFENGIAYTILFREIEELKGLEYVWTTFYKNKNNI